MNNNRVLGKIESYPHTNWGKLSGAELKSITRASSSFSGTSAEPVTQTGRFTHYF